MNTVTFGALGTPDPNQAELDAQSGGTGFSSLVTDVIVLVAIGGAVYLFIKLGGINQIKKLAGL